MLKQAMNAANPKQAWRASILLGGIFFAGCGVGHVSAAELDLIVEALRLEPGSVVADVGAGNGEWAVQLARHVGQEGHVWATEVEADEVEDIESRVLGASLNNVSVVLGDQSSSGLPPDCCDAILLRLVYHHFTRPVEMRASLRQALRPGGLLAIVDISPQSSWRELPDVPDRGGHGIPVTDLIREMTTDGFEVVSRQDEWNGDADRYCVVFRR
jgi:ubiquinone/menaquinone biosynthesis C-methylase UbiE